MRKMDIRLQLLTQETPEGSVFELTPGKAPEGRPRGFGSPPQLTTPEGWIWSYKELFLHLYIPKAGNISL
jgi:hypothetical protein